MRTKLLALSCSALLTALAPAQLSGTYVIGPSSPYQTFTAAAAALSAGVSGPVRFIVSPGTYNESFTLPPVTGASATNTITFVSLVKGLAKIAGASGNTLTFGLGTTTLANAWYVFDGFEFTSGPGVALYSNRYVYDIEVRNCTFLAAHVTYLWNLQGASIGRWKVHHNRFTFIPGTRGFYLSQIDNCLFYENDFDLNGCTYGWYCINSNNSRNRAYNNLFHGAPANASTSCAIFMQASQYDWELSFNTFAVDTGSAAGNILNAGGCCTPTRFTNVYGNVFVNTGAGACIYMTTATAIIYYQGNGNLFFHPTNANPPIAKVATTYYDLAGWKALTNKDAASVLGDPKLMSAVPPYDLRPLAGSAAKDLGVVFPGYATLPTFPITNDYAGTIREDLPDAGAYELRPAFGRYGVGCAGSGSFVPEIGYSGTMALGSTSFTVTLAKALGSTPGLLSLGSSSTTWGPIPLPYGFGGGCSIQCEPLLAIGYPVLGSGPGNGTASLLLPIPNNPALTGATVWSQWLIADAGAGSNWGVCTTGGGAIQL